MPDHHRNRSRTLNRPRYSPMEGGVPLTGKGSGEQGSRAGFPRGGGSPPHTAPPPELRGVGEGSARVPGEALGDGDGEAALA